MIGLERLVHVVYELFDFLLTALPGLDITLELAAPEHPIHRNGDVWERVQTHTPGDRALGGAVGHDRMDRGEESQGVEQEHY